MRSSEIKRLIKKMHHPTCLPNLAAVDSDHWLEAEMSSSWICPPVIPRGYRHISANTWSISENTRWWHLEAIFLGVTVWGPGCEAFARPVSISSFFCVCVCRMWGEGREKWSGPVPSPRSPLPAALRGLQSQTEASLCRCQSKQNETGVASEVPALHFLSVFFLHVRHSSDATVEH